MADKKVTDAPESSGYEMEIDQWKQDLALARQQMNLEKILKKLIKYFKLSNNVWYNNILNFNLLIIRDILNCRDSMYLGTTQERLYKTFYLVKRTPLVSLMKCHW